MDQANEMLKEKQTIIDRLRQEVFAQFKDKVVADQQEEENTKKEESMRNDQLEQENLSLL